MISFSSLIALIHTDFDGSVPLWEAMMGGHESVIKLLIDNGAAIPEDEVGHFACTAVEQNNLELLKKIVQYGGNVTQPKRNGTTALHTAVSEGNTEIVEFLLQQGADIDRPDIHGWTPWALADHQGHEEIKEIFQNSRDGKSPPDIPNPRSMNYSKRPSDIPKSVSSVPPLVRFQSEPTMYTVSRGSMRVPGQDLTCWENRPGHRVNNFNNSLFGIMSVAAYHGMHLLCNNLGLVHLLKKTKGGSIFHYKVIILLPHFLALLFTMSEIVQVKPKHHKKILVLRRI